MADGFCGGCGRTRADGDRFCPKCGRAFDADGAATAPDLIKRVTPVEPPAAPPPKPFDPYLPVGPENPIPPDSIWATAPYPGPMPDAALRGSIPNRIRAIGSVRGRPAKEIIAALGLPQSISSAAGGGRLRQWTKVSVYGGSYHYALRFDPYDICIGITHQRG